MPFRRFTRLDFGPDPGVPTQIPAGIARVYPHLVSAVDSDGNELGGIPLPFVTVPLATHTGWNTRHAAMGGEGQTLSTGGATGGTLRGSTVPFPTTREERESIGDPRLSVEERYDSREHYQELVRQAAQLGRPEIPAGRRPEAAGGAGGSALRLIEQPGQGDPACRGLIFWGGPTPRHMLD